jgi:multiple sugar transport system permease protein
MTDLLDRMRADDADEHIDAAADGRDARSAGSSTTRARIRGVIKHVLLISAALLMLYPVIWMVVSSLRPTEVIFREPGLILTDLELDNDVNGWFAFEYPFSTALFNSTVIVIFSIIGNLVSCSMAAYAFARVEFIGRRVWFAIMLLTIMLPIHVIIVPQYIMFSEIGWTNTFLPLIVPKFLATDAFFIFLMVQFIRGIPRELDEAARIDGCGRAGTFLRVILPLMVPALATTAIFTFIWTWNDFFSQLIYLTDPEMYTVPVALRSFVDATVSTSWGSMFAMNVVSLVPIFLAFLIGQRYLVRGIATTGGK